MEESQLTEGVEASSSSVPAVDNENSPSPTIDLTTPPLTPPRELKEEEEKEDAPAEDSTQNAVPHQNSTDDDDGVDCADSPHLPPLTSSEDFVPSLIEEDESGTSPEAHSIMMDELESIPVGYIPKLAPAEGSVRTSPGIPDEELDTMAEEEKRDPVTEFQTSSEDQSTKIAMGTLDPMQESQDSIPTQPSVVTAEQNAQTKPQHQGPSLPGNSGGNLPPKPLQSDRPQGKTSSEGTSKSKPTRSISDGILSDEEFGENSASLRVRQVAKVKRFFTTLQTFGNKISGEVAEQVQELIAALVNGTATIEEFHQEIQTVTNHPLKEFIIPFLRDNLELFREELKGSSQALSDILGEPPALNSNMGLTPQLMDNELPVLPSSKPGSIPLTPTRTNVTSSATQTTVTPSFTATKGSHTTTTTTPLTTHPPPHSQPHSQSIVGSGSGSRMDLFDGGDPIPIQSGGSPANFRKRQRRVSPERPSGSTDRESLADKIYTQHPVKRPRYVAASSGDYTITVGETPVITPTTAMPSRYAPLPPPPAYPHAHPPPPPMHSHHPPPVEPHVTITHIPSLPTEMTTSRRALVADDWNKLDIMLTSIMGMVERTRQAMTTLKERVLPELGRIETDFERRLNEMVEKVRRQCAEEKQHLLVEASKQMRESVATVKTEMEGRIGQAQAIAVQEALKEVNTQSNSKESCWNCGRRATETCSGCNKARYCGTFCQHKDWSNHMHHCIAAVQAMAEYGGEQQEGITSSAVVKEERLPNEQPVAMDTNDVIMMSSSTAREMLGQTRGISNTNSHVGQQGHGDNGYRAESMAT